METRQCKYCGDPHANNLLYCNDCEEAMADICDEEGSILVEDSSDIEIIVNKFFQKRELYFVNKGL